MASSLESHLMTFYVTRFHAEGSPGVIDVSCIKDEEINHNHRSIFRWFPIRGLKHFNIGWSTCKEHYVENGGRLIVFSASGEYIAVLFNNKVTILRKDDNFTKAFQSFTDSNGKKEEIEATFWKEWSSRIEEQQKLADQARNLEQIIPGVETSRFLSGDTEYIQRVVFSLAESVKVEKKSVLLNGLILANTYGVNRSEVLLQYLSSLLVSHLWTNEEIEAEISVHWNELLEHSGEVLKVLSSTVYTALDASNKQRLGFLYKILSAHYIHIKERLWRECTSSVGDTENLICFKNDLLNFLITMITAGCSFRDIAQICFQGRESIMSDTNLNSADHMVNQKTMDKYEKKLIAIRGKDADSFQDILEAYVALIDSILCEIRSQVSNDIAVEISKVSTRRLCNLLSSLACISYGEDEVNAPERTQQDFVICKR